MSRLHHRLARLEAEAIARRRSQYLVLDNAERCRRIAAHLDRAKYQHAAQHGLPAADVTLADLAASGDRIAQLLHVAELRRDIL